jgi:hypothetical protein
MVTSAAQLGDAEMKNIAVISARTTAPYLLFEKMKSNKRTRGSTTDNFLALILECQRT